MHLRKINAFNEKGDNSHPPAQGKWMA